jgi:hypothetical protein
MYTVLPILNFFKYAFKFRLEVSHFFVRKVLKEHEVCIRIVHL